MLAVFWTFFALRTTWTSARHQGGGDAGSLTPRCSATRKIRLHVSELTIDRDMSSYAPRPLPATTTPHHAPHHTTTTTETLMDAGGQALGSCPATGKCLVPDCARGVRRKQQPFRWAKSSGKRLSTTLPHGMASGGLGRVNRNAAEFHPRRQVDLTQRLSFQRRSSVGRCSPESVLVSWPIRRLK